MTEVRDERESTLSDRFYTCSECYSLFLGQVSIIFLTKENIGSCFHKQRSAEIIFMSFFIVMVYNHIYISHIMILFTEKALLSICGGAYCCYAVRTFLGHFKSLSWKEINQSTIGYLFSVIWKHDRRVKCCFTLFSCMKSSNGYVLQKTILQKVN